MDLLDINIDISEFAWYTGMVFRGLTISETGAGWNIILRCYDKEGDRLYCMTQTNDLREGFKGLLAAVGGKDGYKLWRHDKFAK